MLSQFLLGRTKFLKQKGFMNKIILATRTKADSYKNCVEELEKRFKNNKQIAKIYIICNLYKPEFKIGKIPCKVIFDLKPIRATAFNLVIDELSRHQKSKYHLLTYSKEVELTDDDIETMIKVLKDKEDKIIVVGFHLKDNILSDKEIKLYSGGDHSNNDVGIAYKVPWNTCALWNNKFVYGKGNMKLKFDEICEKDNNQLGELIVKVGSRLLSTDYEGMEDGLAIAELVTKNKGLKYALYGEKIFWNIEGDKDRILNHKLKMARKNIVLSTFMNIKGYSADKLREAQYLI